jgi:hypothetical protein
MNIKTLPNAEKIEQEFDKACQEETQRAMGNSYDQIRGLQRPLGYEWRGLLHDIAPSLAKCHLYLTVPQPPYVAGGLQVNVLAWALRPSFP